MRKLYSTSEMLDKSMLVDSMSRMISHCEKELEEHSDAEILMLYVEGQRDMLTRLLTAIEKGKYDHAAASPIRQVSNCN